jgi:hypothetical protein
MSQIGQKNNEPIASLLNIYRDKHLTMTPPFGRGGTFYYLLKSDNHSAIQCSPINRIISSYRC